MTNIKVSICVPVYGAEKFMEKFGLDTSKRDKRSWMEIIRGSAV